MSDYFEEVPSLNEDIVMPRAKYNELIDIVNAMADKLEDTLSENSILKKQLANYKTVSIDEMLGKYKEILELK